MKKSLRQRGILPSFRFSFNEDTILTGISKIPFACRLGVNRLNDQANADDIVLFCPTANGLQSLLDQLSVAFDDHVLKINASETKLIIFRGQRVLSLRNLKFRDY